MLSCSQAGVNSNPDCGGLTRPDYASLQAELARSDSSLAHPNPVCQEACAIFCLTIARAMASGPEPIALIEESLRWAEAICRPREGAPVCGSPGPRASGLWIFWRSPRDCWFSEIVATHRYRTTIPGSSGVRLPSV
jgi:hypothetical protein